MTPNIQFTKTQSKVILGALANHKTDFEILQDKARGPLFDEMDRQYYAKRIQEIQHLIDYIKSTYGEV